MAAMPDFLDANKPVMPVDFPPNATPLTNALVLHISGVVAGEASPKEVQAVTAKVTATKALGLKLVGTLLAKIGREHSVPCAQGIRKGFNYLNSGVR